MALKTYMRTLNNSINNNNNNSNDGDDNLRGQSFITSCSIWLRPSFFLGSLNSGKPEPQPEPFTHRCFYPLHAHRQLADGPDPLHVSSLLQDEAATWRT